MKVVQVVEGKSRKIMEKWESGHKASHKARPQSRGLATEARRMYGPLKNVLVCVVLSAAT